MVAKVPVMHFPKSGLPFVVQSSPPPSHRLSDAPPAPGVTMKQGDTGELVKTLQAQLATWGFPPAGGTDGVFGAGTAAAVKALQMKLGVTATGAWDEPTKKAVTQDLQSSSSAIRAYQAKMGLTDTTALTTSGGPSSMVQQALQSPWTWFGVVALIGGWFFLRTRPYTELAQPTQEQVHGHEEEDDESEEQEGGAEEPEDDEE